MHMRGQEQRTFHVDLRHTGGYQFTSQAGEDGRPHGPAYLSDEPDPVGASSGPATPALLGSAIAHCLSASLLETLRHAHIAVDDFRADVDAVVVPNAAGLPRIHHVDVVLRPVLREPSKRTGRCAEVFEQHCTVTASVKEGIAVNVSVDWQTADSRTEDAPSAATLTAG